MSKMSKNHKIQGLSAFNLSGMSISTDGTAGSATGTSDFSNLAVKSSHKVNMKRPNDTNNFKADAQTTLRITSCELLPNGGLSLADHANASLKL